MPASEPHARRFEQILGAAIDTATEGDLDGLVKRSVPEDDDLDFKGAPYKDGDELGKDIAAMANTRGGVLVVGIEESNRVASALAPIVVSDDEERRLHQLAAEWVAPVPGFRIREVAGPSPGLGYYLISVPRSVNRPHAVRKSQRLGYPVRRGTTTGWLSESEVASLYRDRFSAAEGAVDRLGRAYDSLTPELDPRYAWLAVCLGPLDTGRLQMSSSLLTRLDEWMTRMRQDLPPGFDGSGLAATARFKRVALRGWVQGGLVQSTYGELHLDGAAAFAVPLGRPVKDSTDAAEIGVEALTVCLVAMLRLVACHAADNVGLAGDAVASARLVRPLIGKGVALVDRDPMHFPRRLGTLMPAEGEHAEATVDLTGLSNSWPDVLTASRDLLSQLQSSYGSPEPAHLDEDGAIRVRFYEQGIQQRLRDWAAAVGAPISEATTA